MKYYYSEEKIREAMKRLRRFRKFRACLSEHFNGTRNCVIEVCGINDCTKEGNGLILKTKPFLGTTTILIIPTPE